jgi:prepilin-type N-terminal cleavage/methylation domain-containing protein
MLHRTGVTLIEVLIAIFISSIGLLALLALFPLGAVNMAQAIKDAKAANAAVDAAATIKTWQISQPHPPQSQLYAPIQNDYFVSAAYAGSAPLTAANPDGPSYAVYVDPMGFESYSSVPAFNSWVAGVPGIRRQTLSIFNPAIALPSGLQPAFIPIPATRRATLLRWFTLPDDITFGKDGVPPAGVFQRENRYSWAYLLRRPRFSDPAVVEMTIAVYDRRPLQLGGGGFLPVGESAYPVEPVPMDPPGSGFQLNTVKLLYAGGLPKPALRPGGWILDATALPGHGYFYRVVSASDTVGSKGQPAVQVELQNNIRTINVVNNQNVPVITQAVVMDSLVEVFERGPVSTP